MIHKTKLNKAEKITNIKLVILSRKKENNFKKNRKN
jgi:hypothetical protein